MVEKSEAAIAIASQRASASGVSIDFLHADLTTEALPPGPWDLVLIVHYLQRDLISRVIERMADNGLLAFSAATVRNIERHERPALPYLLHEGEAPSLMDGLRVIHYAEGWSVEDRHEARLVARR